MTALESAQYLWHQNSTAHASALCHVESCYGMRSVMLQANEYDDDDDDLLDNNYVSHFDRTMACDEWTERDRQTDRQTDRRGRSIIYTALAYRHTV